MRRLLPVLMVLLAAARPATALDRAAVERLAFGESDEKIAAIGALVAEGDPRAAPLLQALGDGEMQTAGERVLVVRGDEAVDALTGEKISPLPPAREDVIANNRLRAVIAAAVAALKLVSADRATRLAA